MKKNLGGFLFSSIIYGGLIAFFLTLRDYHGMSLFPATMIFGSLLTFYLFTLYILLNDKETKKRKKQRKVVKSRRRHLDVA